MADLAAKTDRYEELLAEAIRTAEPAPAEGTPLGDATTDFAEMAAAYLEDGRHYKAEGDRVTALASFAYGHAWLDAGARLGLFDVPGDGYLFTV